MKNNVITLSTESAKAFTIDVFDSKRKISLHDLAEMAREAFEGSETSLAEAQEIAGGGWFSRLIRSGALQKHIIDSIAYIRDISKVNVGLSAFCNDLSRQNLEYAKKIDSHHQATNAQLDDLQQLSSALREQLSLSRQAPLLEKLAPSLEKLKLEDQDDVRSWLRLLADGIDEQYKAVQGNLEALAKQRPASTNSVERLTDIVSDLKTFVTEHQEQLTVQLGTLNIRLTAREEQLGTLNNRLTADEENTNIRFGRVDENIQRSHDVLSAGIRQLHQQSKNQHANFQNAIQNEAASRSVMHEETIALIGNRESVVRTNLGELNQRLLNRLVQVAVFLVVLQSAGFMFLAHKMGLLN